MTLDEVLTAIEDWGPELLAGLLGTLFGEGIAKIPVEALAKAAVDIEKALRAKDEKAAMQDAVAAIDEEILAEQRAERELTGTD